MSTPRQLALDLGARPALGRSDFLVAPANRLALAQVDGWPDWPARRLALSGPAGSGKTHLVHVWAGRTGARVIAGDALPGLDLGAIEGDAAVAVEDADRIKPGDRHAAEEALFHLCNRLAAGGSLLVSGREPPARWAIALPDLASRLGATAVARLDPPDDALLGAVLVKLFADRQLNVAPDLIRLLLGRMERSFAAAEAMVAALDQAGLARHRPITARLAGELLRGSGADQPDRDVDEERAQSG
ncbi:MAG: chromosomal replication initiator DnaA [Amaricoccus sp.]